MGSWQPIETAPRDGTVILLAETPFVTPEYKAYRKVYAGFYRVNEDDGFKGFDWTFLDPSFKDDPTNAWKESSLSHWMPLPEPPDA